MKNSLHQLKFDVSVLLKWLECSVTTSNLTTVCDCDLGILSYYEENERKGTNVRKM